MSGSRRRELRCLDDRRADVLASLCETLVPGCARVGAEVYIDAVLAKAPAPAQQAAVSAIDTLAPHADGGEEALAPLAPTPEFQMIRAMAAEDAPMLERVKSRGWRALSFTVPKAIGFGWATIWRFVPRPVIRTSSGCPGCVNTK